MKLNFWKPPVFATTEALKPSQTEFFVTREKPTIQIRVPANPSTGYNWELDYANNNLISSMGHEYKANPSYDGAVGGGGMSVWDFTFNQQAFDFQQMTRIALVYKRSWNDDLPIQSKEFIITINLNSA